MKPSNKSPQPAANRPNALVSGNEQTLMAILKPGHTRLGNRQSASQSPNINNVNEGFLPAYSYGALRSEIVTANVAGEGMSDQPNGACTETNTFADSICQDPSGLRSGFLLSARTPPRRLKLW
jgi:hypothetical protein